MVLSPIDLNAVRRIALKRIITTASREDAEDAVQEAFIRYVAHKPSLKTQTETAAWVIRVAQNWLNNYRRHNSILSFAQIDGSNVSNGMFEAYVLSKLRMQHSLSLVPPFDRKLIMWPAYGYTNRAIASEFELRDDTIKKRLQRNRQRLKATYSSDE